MIHNCFGSCLVKRTPHTTQTFTITATRWAWLEVLVTWVCFEEVGLAASLPDVFCRAATARRVSLQSINAFKRLAHPAWT